MKLAMPSIKESLSKIQGKARRYTVAFFLLLLLAVYGFLTIRIVVLNQVQPDESAVAAQLKTAGVPHIDQDSLTKIQQLQDNSVEVQSLFDTARSNPFQE